MPRPKGQDKRRTNISISQDTWDRLQQYAWEHHLDNISAAITHLAWQAKVKNEQVRGQTSFNFNKKSKK